jgi:hypothetical protein
VLLGVPPLVVMYSGNDIYMDNDGNELEESFSSPISPTQPSLAQPSLSEYPPTSVPVYSSEVYMGKLLSYCTFLRVEYHMVQCRSTVSSGSSDGD